MNFKRFLLGLAAAMGLGALVMTNIPQTAPVAPLFRTGAELLELHAKGMLDQCDRVTCACTPKDADKDCGIHGPVGFLDGGACSCP